MHCKQCGKDFSYQLKNDLCHECAMRGMASGKYCEKCRKLIVSTEENQRLCAACIREEVNDVKKPVGIAAVILLAIGVAVKVFTGQDIKAG